MIHKVCKDIVNNLKINKFIETGTFLGETVVRVSDWFCDLDEDFGTICDRAENSYLNSFFPKRKIGYPVFKDAKPHARTKIYSVDLDTEKQNILAELFLSNPNINMLDCSSEKFIKEAIDNRLITDTDSTFFYLDAWGEMCGVEYWPLRDEIRQILRLKKAVIAIDDFVVPFRLDHIFSVSKNRVCGWFYIRDLFEGRNIKVYFPKRSNIDYRGTVIIFLGYQEGELEFMKKLPCFSPLFKGDIFLTVFGKFMFFFFEPLLKRLADYLKHNTQRKTE